MAHSNRGGGSGRGTEDDSLGSNEEFIRLKLVSQDNTEIFFRVKRTMKFRKMLKNFADRKPDKQTVEGWTKGLDYRTLRYLFDGTRLSEESTPQSMQMEHDDVIEVYMEQLGGA